MADLFVGRAAELDALGSELARVRKAEARVALVQGSAGVGKTALLRRFIADAEARVLHAGGDEAETQLSFGLLERLVGDLDHPLRRQLAEVVRGQGAVPNPIAVGTELVSLLGELQDGPPVILCLDDAQWSDPPSLAALTFALRRLRADRVLSVISTRANSGAALPEGLRRLVDDGGGIRLRLEGLGVSDLQTLAAAVGGQTLSVRAARRLRDHTEGSPLHALALLREIGPRALDRQDPLPAPSSFALLVLARLGACSLPAARLVVAASVLGQRCSFATALRLAGELPDPWEALEETVSAGLLGVDRARADFALAFRHPLVRAAVYADLGPARRAGLHARAAQLLDGDAALTHRVAAAGPEDPTLADVLIARAAASAARGAWGEAAAHLLSAARLDPFRRQQLVLEAAKLMLVGLDVVAAAAWHDEIAAFPPSADRGYVLGHLQILMGQPEAARALLEEASSRCDRDRQPDVASMIACQLAFLAINDSRGEEGIRWARTALELAPPSSSLAGYARSMLGAALVIAGRPREALGSGSPADGPGSETDTPAVDEVFGQGLLRLWTDDLAGARRDLAPVLDVVKSGDLTPSTFQALIYLAETEFRQGAWDDALVHADLAASLATDTGVVNALPYAHATAASVHALRGRWDLAESNALAALASARSVRQQSGLAYAHLAAAHLALARGNPATLLEAVGPLLEMGQLDGISEPGVVPWQDLHVEALVRLGRLDEAETALSRLETCAAERELHSGMAAAARVRGCLEAARNARAKAGSAFEAGLAYAEPLEMPFLKGLVNLEFGAHLRRTGSRRAAVAQLEAARHRFASLAADPFIARCDRELAACGLHPARRDEHRIQLTPQELAVAHLLTRGMSNREIAAELVVSVKTVEYHLRNIYSKMGTSSRAQLAARMVRTTTAERPLAPEPQEFPKPRSGRP